MGRCHSGNRGAALLVLSRFWQEDIQSSVGLKASRQDIKGRLSRQAGRCASKPGLLTDIREWGNGAGVRSSTPSDTDSVRQRLARSRQRCDHTDTREPGKRALVDTDESALGGIEHRPNQRMDPPAATFFSFVLAYQKPSERGILGGGGGKRGGGGEKIPPVPPGYRGMKDGEMER
ncbi:unnamed protein product [Pleuronectes platessa]|uniref:Uncharacterized protein n=1 Tax=Pleuronectes platessa TaxID=8262 RepID=A0A9N7TY77_PLEPL|nr:unnamed protein product [Pleuronectes platessa]